MSYSVRLIGSNAFFKIDKENAPKAEEILEYVGFTADYDEHGNIVFVHSSGTVNYYDDEYEKLLKLCEEPQKAALRFVDLQDEYGISFSVLLDESGKVHDVNAEVIWKENVKEA